MDAVSLTVRRLAGYVVDAVLLAVVLVPIAWVVSLGLGVDRVTASEVWVRSLVLVSVPAWAYFIVTERRWGAGVAKRLVGLRTVDRSGSGSIGWRAAVLRTAVTLAPWELIHLAFFGLAPRLGEVTTSQVALAIAAYAILTAYLVVTARSGAERSPADVVAGTRVRPAAAAAS